MTGTITCGSITGTLTAGGMGQAIVGEAIVNTAMIGSMGSFTGSITDSSQVDE